MFEEWINFAQGKLSKLHAKGPTGAMVQKGFKYTITFHGTMRKFTGLKSKHWQD